MSQPVTFAGDLELKLGAQAVKGSVVEIEGERYYRITGYDAMPAFLMSLVSDSDHWLFISSTGALTAGRKDPDHALFPYDTDDRLHDYQDCTGSKTVLRVTRDGATRVWEPFSKRHRGMYETSRSLSKSVFGNRIRFEEANEDLELTFSYEWKFSERFGFVRSARLRNDGARSVAVELIDGIQNVLPAGVTRRFQMEYSTLVDGYKRTELVACGVALFQLGSIPVDRPEPSEALRVNVAWSCGLDGATHLLSAKQLEPFRGGDVLVEETEVVGCRGAYLLSATIDLGAGEAKDWMIVADVAKDAADVIELLTTLKSGADVRSEIDEDVRQGTENLARIVGSSDGIQCTDDELSTCRHYSNTLFNVMRGGVPDDGYRICTADFKRFLARADSRIAARHSSFIEALPQALLHSELIARCASQGDVDLERIANEYLPLSFSRRHGDPSRPWNAFSIHVKDENKQRVLNYEGNWRDIFQNWEALSLSFPGYAESMIAKFLNSSTADGYNPYRIMRDGYEWEVSDPHDAWSFIGYWGDHQVVYLLKLLEQSRRCHPDRLAELLTSAVFTYANVPYRLKSFEALVQDARNTITFEFEAHRSALQREAEVGYEGKALLDSEGSPVRANLAEKLLVVILSKLSNYIPEAGIWMNTQRPEWNDANNALVGHAASVVTLCYLRRFVRFVQELFASANLDGIAVDSDIAELFARIASVLQQNASLLNAPISDHDRKLLLEGLGKAGSEYRKSLYARGLRGVQAVVSKQQIADFCEVALRHLDHAIAANRRDDGLFHSYNLIEFSGGGIAILRLYEMLEGQVAALSSGALSTAEAVSVLDALRASSLYRTDQHSYLLYPDRDLPGFLDKNNIPLVEVEKSRLLQVLLSRGDRTIVVRDVNGGVHFNAEFRNPDVLKQALATLKSGELREFVERDEAYIVDLYERVFRHRFFTGRSGTFYKYEGLGCIYWHMVSKLLLAESELLSQAADGDPVLFNRLKAHYLCLREGLGAHKPPQVHGAIPTDPYSHTPKHGGAQQPGMTGQVKEDIICRFGEMGLRVEQGRVEFVPQLILDREFLRAPATFQFYDVQGTTQAIDLASDTLAFTFCQVPVVVHRAGPQRIEVTFADGSTQLADRLSLDSRMSRELFDRTAAISRLDVFAGVETERKAPQL